MRTHEKVRHLVAPVLPRSWRCRALWSPAQDDDEAIEDPNAFVEQKGFDASLGFPGEGPKGKKEPSNNRGGGELPLEDFGRARNARDDPDFLTRRNLPLPAGKPMKEATVLSRQDREICLA